MNIPSKKVIFENDADIINYLTKGITPMKKDVIKVKQGISDGTINFQDQDKNPINSIFTPQDIDLIYKNKRRNDIIGLAMIGGAVIIAFIGGYRIAVKDGVRSTNKGIGRIEQQNTDFINGLSKGNIVILDDDEMAAMMNHLGAPSNRSEVSNQGYNGNIRMMRY